MIAQNLLSQMDASQLMALMMQQQGQAQAAAGGLAGMMGMPQQQQQQQMMGMGGMSGGLPQNANDWFCSGCADKQFAKNQQCRNCGTSKEFGVSDVTQIPDVIEKFLGGKVDARVDAQFRSLPAEHQKTIIERGSLTTARDPSAVLGKRIQELGFGGPRGGPPRQQAGGFDAVALPAYHDPQAPRAGDWYCSNCQDLQFGKNTSCRRCGLPREQVDHGKPELDPQAFVAPFTIDEDKKAAFLAMDFALQEQIMLKGSLAGARDPTAVLCQRMGQAIASAKAQRQIQQAMGMGGAPQHGPRPGDWYCSVCHDLQFAKNEVCRTCNTPRAMADTGEIPKLDALTWISMFTVEEDKKEQFLNMTTQMQEAIIAEGTLHGARDPTAVLISRMNKQCKISKGMVAGCKGGGKSFGPAGGKSNMGMESAGPYGGCGMEGGAGSWDGGGGGGSSEEDEWAWIASKGFLQAMKGKGKGQ